jgi:hypothetical protein
MDFERLERAWNGPANTPSEAAGAYVVDEMMETLRKRRQATTRLTGFIGVVLVFWTALIAWKITVDPFPFDLAREWAIIPLYLLPWVGLFLIKRRQRRHLTAHPDPYASTAATLRALLDENLTARRRLVITSALMLACLAVVAVALSQLVAVGKMTPTNVLQGSIALGGLMAAIAVYKAWHYARVLKPESKRLERLISDYGAA